MDFIVEAAVFDREERALTNTNSLSLSFLVASFLATVCCTDAGNDNPFVREPFLTRPTPRLLSFCIFFFFFFAVVLKIEKKE